MPYIPQKHLENLRQLVVPGKVVVICGARRVGKTTLVKEYLKGVKAKSLLVDGDDRPCW
jgi:predicted AAA+ superfamily ATPase